MNAASLPAPHLDLLVVEKIIAHSAYLICFAALYHGKAMLRWPCRVPVWTDKKCLSPQAAFPYSNQIVDIEWLTSSPLWYHVT